MKYFDPVVTDRYAQALFAVAKERGRLQPILDDMRQLGGLDAIGAKLTVFLESPQISTENKVELFEKAMRGRVDDLLVDFLDLLLKKNRINHARPIFERYRVLVERDQGLHQGTVETAVPLDDAQKRDMQAALERYMGRRLILQYVVNPDVVAGVRFKSDDLLLEDTVQGKLHRLRAKLETRLKH